MNDVGAKKKKKATSCIKAGEEKKRGGVIDCNKIAPPAETQVELWENSATSPPDKVKSDYLSCLLPNLTSSMFLSLSGPEKRTVSSLDLAVIIINYKSAALLLSVVS